MRNLKALVSVAMIAISMTGVAATKSNAVKRTTKKDREPAVGMANPASVFCEKHGGKSINVKDKDGNETGKCQFKDGTKVDEWNYYRENN